MKFPLDPPRQIGAGSPAAILLSCVLAGLCSAPLDSSANQPGSAPVRLPVLPRKPWPHQATRLSLQYSLMSDPTPPLPAPSFDFLVWSLRLQTESHLGLTPWSQEKPEVNLPLARHSIDLLAMLQEKTRNNLSMEEQRLLDNTLTELRFRYIQSFENEQKRKAEDSAAAPDQPSPGNEASAAEQGPKDDA